MKSVLLLLISLFLGHCYPPPHPLVVSVRNQEESLPPHLRSPVLRNPQFRKVWPWTSHLHRGENIVHQRESDRISRENIYSLLTHAGLVPRRGSNQSPQHLFQPAYNYQPHPARYNHQFANNYRHHEPILPPKLPKYGDFEDPPFFPAPDELLQYL